MGGLTLSGAAGQDQTDLPETLKGHGAALEAKALAQRDGKVAVLAVALDDALSVDRSCVDAALYIDVPQEQLVDRFAGRRICRAAGCGAMLKDYGNLLARDRGYAERAEYVSSLARDITEFGGWRSFVSSQPAA